MEIKISLEDIAAFEKQDRTNLINGLSGYKSAHLIGTQDKHGASNLAIFSSVVHIGANPPLMGFIQRPIEVERHTYENIKETGYYTINHVPLEYYKAAHQTSARFNKEQSEFDACGFTPFYSPKHLAPYVGESPIKIGLELKEEIKITSNNTILIVGEIKELFLDPSFILENGMIDLGLARTILVHGLETYYKAEKIGALPYAKPNLNILQNK
ncbi:MAG: flavin reductase [Bacteroidia bacterium]|nr:flavin reductase [Bacteroidia bacterium]MCF8426740.1 flavin reductase [Bacteroidia bacterium]MCF8446709.1 flavin reductase [Bacteroidia bacterium]